MNTGINTQKNRGEVLVKILKRYGIGIVLLLLVIVSGIIEPAFLSMRNITNVLRQVSINGIIAIGMTFVIISDGIDLSVGSVACLLGMLAIQMQAHMSFVFAILLVVLLGAIASIVVCLLLS